MFLNLNDNTIELCEEFLELVSFFLWILVKDRRFKCLNFINRMVRAQWLM